ncbi:Nn.00g112450.m01.CDS01 [Neocucurbitaria sp. VM-36]
MSTLARLNGDNVPNIITNGTQNPFKLVSYYIGQLGHRFYAAKTLLSYALQLPELQKDVKVCGIGAPPAAILPPIRGATTLSSIVGRMMQTQGPELDRYQKALLKSNAKEHIFKRFLANYTDQNITPRVHVEIQVLEKFYAENLSFADNDPFIACSKPACLCCMLYFRNHRGHFVEPYSHGKICLGWRPPDTDAEVSLHSELRQRDILNDMATEIRKRAFHHIDEQSTRRLRHSGLQDRATELNILEQVQEQSSQTNESIFAMEELLDPNEQLDELEDVTNMMDRISLSTSSPFVNTARPHSRLCHDDWQHQSTDESQSMSDDDLSDSDEEGGVLL